MRLQTIEVANWPKLTWVARCVAGNDVIAVHHGPRVEVAPDWCAEAVWAGAFEAGEFDRTDLVFGSGVRCRGDRVVFVASGSTCDRLWYAQRAAEWTVSNSLPALLALSKTSLDDDHPRYKADIWTIIEGLDRVVRTLPARGGEIHVQYFHNLVFDGHMLREERKPDGDRVIDGFESYRRLLTEGAKAIGANLAATTRKHAVVPLASISRGYDSPTVAAISRLAGCEATVTFSRSRSRIPRDDSGKAIAEKLGMRCREYERTIDYTFEEYDWATQGYVQDINLFAFEYPEPVCFFFTGFHGDKIWDVKGADASHPLARGDSTGLGFCEFRLAKGILHCPLPFWGALHAREIQAVSASRAMDAWRVGGDYDRPICRRILEESGVPREAFGMRKNASAVTYNLPWPRSERCIASFKDYVTQRGVAIPYAWPLRLAYTLDLNLLERVRGRLGIPYRYNIQYVRRAHTMLFQWANHELRDRLQAALAEA